MREKSFYYCCKYTKRIYLISELIARYEMILYLLYFCFDQNIEDFYLPKKKKKKQILI